MITVQFNAGWFGFGISKGLFTEINCGPLQVLVYGKPIVESYAELRDDLKVAHAGLRIAERQLKKQALQIEQLELQLEATQRKRAPNGRFVGVR